MRSNGAEEVRLPYFRGRQRRRAQLIDFRYYPCSGTDGYRFSGERICTNAQIRAESLETAIWEYVSRVVKNLGIIDRSCAIQIGRPSAKSSAPLFNALRLGRLKWQEASASLWAEHPPFGADYGNIVPGVKSRWKAIFRRTSTRRTEHGRATPRALSLVST